MARISPGGQSVFSFSDRPDRRLNCDRGIVRRVRFQVPLCCGGIPASQITPALLVLVPIAVCLRLGRIRGCGKSNHLFHAAGHVYAALFAGRRRPRHPATDSRRPRPFHSLHSIHDRALDRIGDHGGLPGDLPDLLPGSVALHWHRHCVACSSFLSLLFASFLAPIRSGLGCLEQNPGSTADYSAAGASDRSGTGHTNATNHSPAPEIPLEEPNPPERSRYEPPESPPPP